jgi:hypothetical protein
MSARIESNSQMVIPPLRLIFLLDDVTIWVQVKQTRDT